MEKKEKEVPNSDSQHFLSLLYAHKMLQFTYYTHYIFFLLQSKRMRRKLSTRNDSC